MLRIHFTADDLARTRLRPTLGPLCETVFALGLLQHPVGRAHHHLRGLLARHHHQVHPVDWRPLSTRAAVPPHLLSLIERVPVAGVGRPPGVSRAAASAGVSRLWRSAIEPSWDRISDYLAAEAEWRARLTARGGVEQLLSALHPKVTWEAPVLTVAGDTETDFHLGGRGLLLTPSVFLAHRPAVLVSTAGTDTQALVFAAPPGDAEAVRLLDPPDSPPRDLSALVGHTRAAVLRELIDPHTTTELAGRLRISTAGASQHAAVLRKSGLIITRRFRNKVFHSMTPLGRALSGVEPPMSTAAGS